MPSAANAKSEKPASSEATDNSPIRQIMTIIEHKIRNLEKRKGKLTQYRDLQKAGKELKGDQKVAVAKYDEVAQTLEFARDISKQIASIATAAERDAKKQAKKDAWVRSATETSKIREVLLILDCLTQMGSEEAREDFLNGTNGAAKLTESDLKILDDLYPEVTPKHEANEEGQPGFQAQSARAADHLCSIIDGKHKEVIGTTYARIKEIVATVHQCGYFDRLDSPPAAEHLPPVEESPAPEEPVPVPVPAPAPVPVLAAAPELEAGAPPVYPVPPAPAVVPAPGYPLCPLPPITLQEVEHAYFAQQYPLQRPIAEVIGSQNFFFLQESEIDSPTGTPQPPALPAQPSPGPIPSQTFTNQHFIVAAPRAEPAPPPQHFPAPPERAAYPSVPTPRVVAAATPLPPQPAPAPAPLDRAEERARVSPAAKPDDEWVESGSPEREEGERRTQGQGDAQGRYRRYGRGRGAANGHRGRGYQARPADSYRREYQPRGKEDGYRAPRRDYRDSRPDYCGNGDAEETRDHHENGAHAYQGGFKGRGRGGSRPRGSRPPRTHYAPAPRRHDAPAAAAE